MHSWGKISAHAPEFLKTITSVRIFQAALIPSTTAPISSLRYNIASAYGRNNLARILAAVSTGSSSRICLTLRASRASHYRPRFSWFRLPSSTVRGFLDTHTNTLNQCGRNRAGRHTRNQLLGKTWMYYLCLDDASLSLLWPSTPPPLLGFWYPFLAVLVLTDACTLELADIQKQPGREN